MTVTAGIAEYPKDILKKFDVKVDAIDTNFEGFEKAVNIVLLGRLSRYFDIDKIEWLKAIESCVKPEFVEMNKKAFELGV